MTAAPLDVRGQLARGSALTLGSTVLARAAGMANAIVVARLLDPYRVGVFAIVSYVLSLVGAFADFGMPVAAMKLVAEYEATRSSALKGLLLTLTAATLVTAGVAGGLLIAGADALAMLYQEPALAPLFRVAGVVLFLSVTGSLVAGVLQGFQRIDVLAVVGVVKALITLAVTVLLLPWVGLVGILVGAILAEVVAGAIAARPLARAVASHWGSAGEPPSRRTLGRAIGLALPVFLSGLALWGTPWLLRSFLVRTHDYAAVGLYQVADAFSRVLLLLPGAVSVPVTPAVAALAAAAPGQISGLTQTTLRLTTLVTLPAALFLFLVARPLLALAYGAAYAEAGPLLRLLIMAAFFQCASVIVWSVLVGLGRLWVGLVIQGIGQAGLLILAVVLLPSVGLAGLGIAHVVAAAAGLLLGLGYLAGRLGLAFDGLQSLLPLGLLGWTAAWILVATGSAGLPQAVVVAGGIVAWEARRLNGDERSWLKTAVRRMVPGRA